MRAFILIALPPPFLQPLSSVSGSEVTLDSRASHAVAVLAGPPAYAKADFLNGREFFEKLVNLTRIHAPNAVFCFNSSPDSTMASIERNLPAQ